MLPDLVTQLFTAAVGLSVNVQAVLFVVMNNEYISCLMKIYACVSEPDPEKREKKLDSAFGKAWMLHCSVDDLLEEE